MTTNKTNTFGFEDFEMKDSNMTNQLSNNNPDLTIGPLNQDYESNKTLRPNDTETSNFESEETFESFQSNKIISEASDTKDFTTTITTAPTTETTTNSVSSTTSNIMIPISTATITTLETTSASKTLTGIESESSTDNNNSKTPSSRNLENPKVDQNLLLAGFSNVNVSTSTSSEFPTENSIFKELSTFPIKENSDEVSNDSSFTEKMTNSEINDERRITLLKQRLPNGTSPNATDLIIDNDDREITLQKINSNQRLSTETLISTIINNDDREMTLQKEDSNQRLPNETLNSTIINYDDGSRMVLQKEDSHQEPPNKTPNSTINNDDREKTLHKEDRNQILPNETLNSTIINYDDGSRMVLQKGR
jgi:hypothetical protein